jgi:hypothetical protein
MRHLVNFSFNVSRVQGTVTELEMKILCQGTFLKCPKPVLPSRQEQASSALCDGSFP